MQKIADMLATMRRSLKLVGNVPEFSGGMEKLQVSAMTVPLIPSALVSPQKVFLEFWTKITPSSVLWPTSYHALS